MANTENNVIAESSSTEVGYAVADKEELVTAFNNLSDEEKAQFYEDCRNGISLEDARQAMYEKIRQLWGK